MTSAIRTVGDVPPIGFDRVAILFDRESGEILHHHRVTITRRDLTEFGEDDLRERAMLAAANFVAEGRLANADVLTMHPEDLARAHAEAADGAQTLRVDVDARGLICLPQERSAH